MKKTDYSSWRRLERVIESSGLTINSFARYVGLPRGENLYQIKRGNYGVSLGVAKKIHAKFPQYPISWLMHGEAESAATPEGDAFVVRIPVYRDSSVAEFPPKEVPERYLLLSAEEARGAQIALCTDDQFGTVLQHWLVLLREPDGEVINGRVYFVMTECFYLFCSVYRIEGYPALLRLKSLFATADDDLEVRCEEICVMWPVCGAICGLK